MQIACACASASMAPSISMLHSRCSMVLVMACANVGPSASCAAVACAAASTCPGGYSALKKPQRSPSSPVIARPLEQFRRAALADDAGQNGAGAHVASGQSDTGEQERGAAVRSAVAEIGGHRQDRTG